MFSRPDRSGWKPAPTSMSPAIRPRVSTSPLSGSRTPEISLSSVDFPDPLKPSSATDCPCSTAKETPSSALKVEASGLRFTAATSVSLREWVCRNRNVLVTSRTTMLSAGGSEILGKAPLQTSEHELPEDQHEERDDHGDAAVEPQVAGHLALAVRVGYQNPAWN